MENNLSLDRILNLFQKIASTPHGSGNMTAISNFIVDFAKENNLSFIKDDAENVIVYKNATEGYENSEPIILQGHLDMVCQKTADCDIDFENDGLKLYVDGDFLKAKNTTLGADNGIAVAMILAILERNDIKHPAIEAVFTTDEEIGMIGATKLDASKLKAKRMINLDSEDEGIVTVSCAGGSDFRATLPITRKIMNGTEITVVLKGLQGGHSGVEIDKGRVNANILAGRFLCVLSDVVDFEIINISGGDKANAIPNMCEIKLCCFDAEKVCGLANGILANIKNEISARESGFNPEIKLGDTAEYQVFASENKNDLIYALTLAPNGVLKMSAQIDGLVETSLNLGILKCCENQLIMHFALRSNKRTALDFLQRKMELFYSKINCKIEKFGYYPPWEYKENSKLREIYSKTHKEVLGYEPKIEAIHAGLECAVFSKNIENLDCIAVGPSVYQVHTVNERMSISSVDSTFALLIKVLENCK